MRRIFVAAALALAAPAPARAGMLTVVAPCESTDGMLAMLQDKYHEHVIGGGLNQDGMLVRQFSADGGATFTLMVSTPQGFSCILASGENWVAEDSPPKGPPL